jgi:hypothetical protein
MSRAGGEIQLNLSYTIRHHAHHILYPPKSVCINKRCLHHIRINTRNHQKSIYFQGLALVIVVALHLPREHNHPEEKHCQDDRPSEGRLPARTDVALR